MAFTDSSRAPQANPLRPLDIAGGPCRLNASIVFNNASGKWTLFDQNDGQKYASPYARYLDDNTSSPTSVVTTLRPIYTPLLHPREIRLLVICPQNFGIDSLRCFSVHASLDDEPRFTALSYTWGKSTDKEQILLNGCQTWIRKNLHDALWRLQLADHFEFVWPMLCVSTRKINQRRTFKSH